jgi:transglutaminase-like putative cysteine protease
MNLAPQVDLTTCQYPLSNGKAGVFQTIDCMRSMVDHFKTNPQIRQATVNAVYLTPAKNQDAEVTAVFEFVRDHIRYLMDIVGVETLATPDKTLLCQIGDCDDQSTLLASMFESIGYPTRFIVAGYSDPANLEHVYLQVLVDNEWVDCDPTESQPLGFAPPGAVVLYAERVESCI